MAASLKLRRFSSKAWENRASEEGENQEVSMFQMFPGAVTENIILQRLILIARLSSHLTERTELGAHYKKLHFQLSKQYNLDHMTGLLLIYPSCLLHVVESSRDVLLSVLKDMKDLQQQQQQSGRAVLETSKVVFLAHNPQRRLFQQWSYEMIKATQRVQTLEEEESTESLIGTVVRALQKLSNHLETSQDVPETKELMVSQEVLLKLLARDDLLSPQQHLQLYNSPLNICMNSGQVVRSHFINTV